MLHVKPRGVVLSKREVSAWGLCTHACVNACATPVAQIAAWVVDSPFPCDVGYSQTACHQPQLYPAPLTPSLPPSHAKNVWYDAPRDAAAAAADEGRPRPALLGEAIPQQGHPQEHGDRSHEHRDRSQERESPSLVVFFFFVGLYPAPVSVCVCVCVCVLTIFPTER